jgi:hypothetical protein
MIPRLGPTELIILAACFCVITPAIIVGAVVLIVKMTQKKPQ